MGSTTSQPPVPVVDAVLSIPCRLWRVRARRAAPRAGLRLDRSRRSRPGANRALQSQRPAVDSPVEAAPTKGL